MNPKILLSTFLLFVPACGGGNAKPPEVGEEPSPARAGEGSGDPGSRSEEANGEAPSASEAGCADGTCFACGGAICLSGYACNESATPAVCTWVPSCAPKNDCACLERALPGCRCESRKGTFLTCD